MPLIATKRFRFNGVLRDRGDLVPELETYRHLGRYVRDRKVALIKTEAVEKARELLQNRRFLTPGMRIARGPMQVRRALRAAAAGTGGPVGAHPTSAAPAALQEPPPRLEAPGELSHPPANATRLTLEDLEQIRADLSKMKRSEVDEFAATVKINDPGSYPNKEALIAAIVERAGE